MITIYKNKGCTVLSRSRKFMLLLVLVFVFGSSAMAQSIATNVRVTVMEQFSHSTFPPSPATDVSVQLVIVWPILTSGKNYWEVYVPTTVTATAVTDGTGVVNFTIAIPDNYDSNTRLPVKYYVYCTRWTNDSRFKWGDIDGSWEGSQIGSLISGGPCGTGLLLDVVGLVESGPSIIPYSGFGQGGTNRTNGTPPFFPSPGMNSSVPNYSSPGMNSTVPGYSSPYMNSTVPDYSSPYMNSSVPSYSSPGIYLP